MGQRQRLPEDLAVRESAWVKERRAKGAGVASDAPAVGLALSGGGIRSATFSLGVLQGLARLGLLKRFDYLSTVSGGGYVGSFFGSLFCRPAGTQDAHPALVEAGIAAPQSPSAEGPRAIHESVRWLRENGRYLTPGGSGDGFWAAAMVLRNLVAVHIVMGLLWLLLFILGDQIVGRSEWMDNFSGIAIGGQWVVYPSPWLAPLPVVAAMALPLGWAYWLVKQPKISGRAGMVMNPWMTAAAFVPWAFITGWAWIKAEHLPALGGGLLLVGALALGAVFFWILMGRDGADRALLRLTAALRWVFIATVAGLAFALVDTVGWTLHAHFFPLTKAHGEGWARMGEHIVQAGQTLRTPGGLLATILAGAATFKDKLQKLFAQAEKGGWKPLLISVLLNSAALIVALLGLGLLSALAHALAFGGAVPAGPAALRLNVDGAFWSFLAGLVLLNVLLGRTIGFLNLSTLGPTYTAALTRAYPGASNPKRREGDVTPHPIEGDDLPWSAYRPWERGGPLHIINVTLNETTGGRSQVIQKDRKGMNLAVGPAGISVGVRHHAVWEGDGGLRRLARRGFTAFAGDQDVLRAEPLTVGQWVGISGAAFSTGLGNRTSWATSMLAGFLNVRLGYWWWSDTSDHRGLRVWAEALLPVQIHLLEEWMAHFPGTHSRHWYLSDGGHFENTAVYELIRRRLPFILLCDDGADPDRSLEDLANLIQKARLDMATKITPMDHGALQAFFKTQGRVPASIGSLDQISDPKHPALAALAHVEYLGDNNEVCSTGLLLILKPTLAPDLPWDVLTYAKRHPAFPQETTGDQFYDETQWESYRALGEYLVTTVIHQAPGLIPS